MPATPETTITEHASVATLINVSPWAPSGSASSPPC